MPDGDPSGHPAWRSARILSGPAQTVPEADDPSRAFRFLPLDLYDLERPELIRELGPSDAWSRCRAASISSINLRLSDLFRSEFGKR